MAFRVFFITNRNYIPTNKEAIFGGQFNPDGVAALRFGYADYTVTDGKPVRGSVSVYPDLKAPPMQAKQPAKGSRTFLDDLHDLMRQGKDTLIFIHGFNVSFLEALDAGAALATEIPQDVNVVVFSWPSDGKAVPLMSYYSDREDARASGPALARAYLKLYDFLKELREAEVQRRLQNKAAPAGDIPTELCSNCLHVLAHSMGNYVLRNGVQAIRAKDPTKLVRMFDQVIMAAPDEDDDTFEHDEKLRILPTLARRITVYHNRHDRALVISDKTKANPDRLGSEGPRMLDLLPKKVIIVDCARVAAAAASLADRIVGHGYVFNSLAMSVDLTSVLADEEDGLIANREVIRAERAYRLIA